MFEYLTVDELDYLRREQYLLGGFFERKLDKKTLLENLKLEESMHLWEKQGFDPEHLTLLINEINSYPINKWDPSQITRRTFLRRLIKGGVLLGGAGAAAAIAKYIKKSKRKEQLAKIKEYALRAKQFSLKELINEKDNPYLQCIGFPTKVARVGFQLIPIVYKNPKREILIFAETHGKSEEEILELVELLISRYGFDSIGLETLYGPPSRDLIKKRSADIIEQFGNTSIKGVRRVKGGKVFAVKGENLLDVYVPDSHSYLLKQKRNITYGIESKEALFDNYAMMAFYNILLSILSLSRDRYGKHRFWNIPTQILTQLIELSDRLRKKRPQLIPHFCFYDFATSQDTNWFHEDQNNFNSDHGDYHKQIGTKCPIVKSPFKSKEELRKHRVSVINQFKRFIYIHEDYWMNKRNIAIAKNITAYMEQLGSKKGIVLIGWGHVFSMLRTKEHPTCDPDNELQKLIPFNSLGINTTGRKL